MGLPAGARLGPYEVGGDSRALARLEPEEKAAPPDRFDSTRDLARNPATCGPHPSETTCGAVDIAAINGNLRALIRRGRGCREHQDPILEARTSTAEVSLARSL